MKETDDGLSRRQFLKTAALTSAALTAPAGTIMLNRLQAEAGGRVKIDKIDVYPARYPMTGYFKFFAGPRGRQGRAAVFVKVTASDGTIGWGQSVPIAKWSYETLEAATVALKDYYAPLLIGKDPADIGGIHQIMDQAIAMSFTTGMPISRAGIDIALWDLVGRLQKRSIAELWGKQPGGAIDLSWTVNARTLEEIDGIMKAGAERGYRNFNIKVAPDPEFDIALARRVRNGRHQDEQWSANSRVRSDSELHAAPPSTGASEGARAITNSSRALIDALSSDRNRTPWPLVSDAFEGRLHTTCAVGRTGRRESGSRNSSPTSRRLGSGRGVSTNAPPRDTLRTVPQLSRPSMRTGVETSTRGRPSGASCRVRRAIASVSTSWLTGLARTSVAPARMARA